MSRMSRRFDHIRALALDYFARGGRELADVDRDTERWACEHWTIVSIRQLPGLKTVLAFLVDPMFEGSNKASAAWAVWATKRPPLFEADTGNVSMHDQNQQNRALRGHRESGRKCRRSSFSHAARSAARTASTGAELPLTRPAAALAALPPAIAWAVFGDPLMLQIGIEL